MAHFTRADLAHDKAIPGNVEVAVVGAGMAGLYVTWRLLRENRELDIVMIDRLNRTGGRLDSDLIEFEGE